MKAAGDVIALPGESSEMEVVVLNIDQPYDRGDGGGRVSAEEFFDETDFPDSVPPVVEKLSDAGIEVRKQRTHGSAPEEILRVASEIDADLITMSGRKRSPTGKVLFGSVTQSVLLDAERPVLVSTLD